MDLDKYPLIQRAFCVQNDHKHEKAVADVDLLTIEIEQDLQGLDYYFLEDFQADQ